MPRLRRVDVRVPGIARVRRGRGFGYRDAEGRPIDDPDTLDRIRSLAIPPAWREVWICADPCGHIQATGTDAAGRQQYLYHPVWRQRRDLAKFDRVLDVAARLPALREVVQSDLAGSGLTRRRVLAAAVRLLDLGFFRVGGEQYAESNGSYGLATLRREHVSVHSGVLTFDYPAKGGKQRIQHVADEPVVRVVRALLRRRGGGEELLAYRLQDRWVDVRSDDINAHLRELLGTEVSAKDFRTWNATVLAAVALAVSRHARSESARQRAVSRAMREVADYLGNTPAVCRSSYVDPRVVDRYRQGRTIVGDLDRLGANLEFGSLATQGAVEQAVLELLRPNG